MYKGLIAYTNEKYLPLTEAFVESILKFSSLSATIFTAGFSYNFKNNRITNKQLEDLELNKDLWSECCIIKQYICSQTPYDITFYLDTDIIITKEFEPWFDSVETTIASLEELFCCKHPHFPCNKDNHSLLQFFKKFGLSETSNYIFAAGYAYNRKFIPRFLDIHKKAINLLKEGTVLPTADECVLNLDLLQNNLIYDNGYDFLPNVELFNSYINKSLNPKQYFHPIYLEEGRYIKPVLFHGNKNVNYAWHMIEEIEKHT